MTHDEHQRERMRFWARIYGSSFLDGNLSERCSDFADDAVVEFDKRFPPPLSESQSPIAPAQEKSKTEIVKDLAQAKGMLFRDISEPKVQAAVEPVPAEPPMLFARTLAAMEERDAAAELAALREKARLYDKLCSELGPLKKKAEFWDAVGSGKVTLYHDKDGTIWCEWHGGQSWCCAKPTAEEAIQAAIDAGALK